MTNKAGVIMTHRVGLKIIMRKCCAEIVTCPQFIELWIKLVLVPFTCKLERTGSNCTMKQYFIIVDRLNIPPQGCWQNKKKIFFLDQDRRREDSIIKRWFCLPRVILIHSPRDVSAVAGSAIFIIFSLFVLIITRY